MASEPKVAVNFRTPLSAKVWLEELAEEHRVDRSDVIRAALAVARVHSKELATTIEARR